MLPPVGRRGVVLGGVAVAVGACAPRNAQPPADTTAPSPSPTGSTGPGAGSGTASNASWQRLARDLDGSLARPGSPSYAVAKQVQNPRFDGARPLAVLSAASSADVATGLAFAQQHGLPVAIRSGGHSYPGWSAGDHRLVIDVRPLHGVRLRGTTARVGAGASLIQVYDALGTRGRGIAAGSCPTVGIAGLTQGGGIGVLTRAHGLTCDQVTAMHVVLADGRAVTASRDHHPDLYWALRGGGGGHLGVVTAFELKTFGAPRITREFLAWPLSAAGPVLQRWLETAPTADRRLWSTVKLLGGRIHTGGPVLVMSAVWAGPAGGFDAAIRPFLSHVPRPTTRVRTTQGYLDTMRAYAGCSTIPVARCHTGPGGSVPRQAFAATSHIVDAPRVDLTALLHHVHAAQGGGLDEAGIALDSLGGAVRDLGPSQTAFGHRHALATVQYTATYAGGPATRALAYVRGFRSAMTPTWGEGAYVNYADQPLKHYRHDYFGPNAPRLAAVRRTYDPHHFFTQPEGY